MVNRIDGIGYKHMIAHAARNLNIHCQQVNELNVFPVPDGDTGTNMVVTIQKGLQAVGDDLVDLPSVSRKFANSVVFEARGNSGVIVSQFLKGVSEGFYDAETVEGETLVEALETGVRYAYASVATPVEGTMLTVVKDATAAVKREFTPLQSVGRIVDSFVLHAKESLRRTPELLPVLKNAGVVDSGGAGIVYLFEGMQKYLTGVPLEDTDMPITGPAEQRVDYDAFNPHSTFPYGYCTELLLQLLHAKEPFRSEEFRAALMQLGDSVVSSVQEDKVRIHIHTQQPEKVFSLCHRYGEFLSVKVENMTVQHSELSPKVLCAQEQNRGAFALVAVAQDETVQKLFVEMGADAALCCRENVSTKDYIDAFEKVDAPHIFAFPNSSDAILSAVQAKKLYRKARITVLPSRSIAECYAALPAVDFEQTDIERVSDDITKIINNLYVVSIARRTTPIRCGDKNICGNAYYSFSGKELLLIGNSLEETVVGTVDKVMQTQEKEIITVFHKASIPDYQLEAILEGIDALEICAEVFTVPVEKLASELMLSFE